jgi:hypothetical protein
MTVIGAPFNESRTKFVGTVMIKESLNSKLKVSLNSKSAPVEVVKQVGELAVPSDLKTSIVWTQANVVWKSGNIMRL